MLKSRRRGSKNRGRSGARERRRREEKKEEENEWEGGRERLCDDERVELAL